MFKSKHNKILLIIFLFTLILRLFLAFHVPNFTYDSYYHLRQVEHITETGLPLYQDELSYGGRELPFLPLFHYLSALLSFIFPLEIIAKIINNLLFSLLIPLIFLIAKKTSKENNASLFSALVAALLPINFQTNSFTPLPLTLVLVFLSIYFFLHCNKKQIIKNKLHLLIISLTLLTLNSPLASLLIFSLIFYIPFSKLEEQKLNNNEIEIILFSTFFFLWIQLLFFKKIFLTSGLSFIWQNIPSEIMDQFFPNFNLSQTILLIGIVPLLAGVFHIYSSLLEKKNKNLFLLISFAISTIFLTWLKLIPFQSAISFLGLILAIIFASFYVQMVTYYKRSKLSTLNRNIEKKIKKEFKKRKKIKKEDKLNYFINIFSTLILLILIPSMLIPAISYSLNQETPSDSEIKTFGWLKNNTENGNGILSTINEGNIVTYITNKKNMMDLQFNLIPDIEERLNNLNSLYTTNFQTYGLELLDKYGIDYIVLTESAKEEYEIEKINYFNEKCFKLIYDDEINQIYEVKCELSII